MGPRWTLTILDRQCKGSSLGPGRPQPYPLTKPRHSLLLYTFILASTKLTFLSFKHSFTDSIHFFFGLPAGRLPTHSPQYIRLTNRLSFILSLIHISEPTRLLSISYAVFCL